uniref:Uncharacterized protein n=1 Tax=Arundo donax TaxID=35708 RepID=A0A0A9GRR5_ARUDO
MLELYYVSSVLFSSRSIALLRVKAWHKEFLLTASSSVGDWECILSSCIQFTSISC